MEGSVKVLSKYITFARDHEVPHGREPLWGRYPVVEALIKIGRPAIPIMIANLENSTDILVRELSARVIRYIEEPEIGKVIIEIAMKKQADAAKKKKLQASLKYFIKNTSK
jgi:hypothetical protein